MYSYTKGSNYALFMHVIGLASVTISIQIEEGYMLQLISIECFYVALSHPGVKVGLRDDAESIVTQSTSIAEGRINNPDAPTIELYR